jgi:hypothetical protein
MPGKKKGKKKAGKKAARKAARIQPDRPRDPNQFAHALIQEMTERQEAATTPTVSASDISRVMAELGRRGGKVGGANRAMALSPERRREIALKAARKRWDGNRHT